MSEQKIQKEREENLRENAGSKDPENATSQPVVPDQEKAKEESALEQQRKEALTERD